MISVDDQEYNDLEETKSMALTRVNRAGESMGLKSMKSGKSRRKRSETKKHRKPPLTPEEELNKDYILLSKPQSITDVQITQRNIKLSNHIVVCGFHSSMYHFILPLRAKYLMKYQQDILIIAPYINKEVWEKISRFPRVFIIEGSPLSYEVLK